VRPDGAAGDVTESDWLAWTGITSMEVAIFVPSWTSYETLTLAC